MASPPVLNLSGLWIFDGQTEQLDNVLAGLKGDNVADGRGVSHGTYTRLRYYRVVMDAAPLDSPSVSVSNAVLNIFDEDGYFGHFVWNGSDAWEARNEPVTLRQATAHWGRSSRR